MIRAFRLSWLVMALAVAGIAPGFADSFLVFTEAGIPDRGSNIWTWCDAGQPCDIRELQECDTPEGSHNLRANTNVWAGWGVFFDIDGSNNPQPRNLSAYASGDVRFFIKTAYNVKVEMQCRVSGQTQTKSRYISNHGWNGTNTWQEITIPISSFFAPQPVDMNCLGAIIAPFMVTIENLPFFNTFRVDNVRWYKADSHSGPSSVQVQGRKLLVGGAPFAVNGVAYSPISICEDSRGALQRDRADRYSIDFPLMASTGVNTVRIYSTFMTTAMLDAARAQGLYVIPTFPIDTVQLSCAAGRTHMKNRFVDAVQEWKNHPAILAWLVGNEVNRQPGLDLCGTWYPQLNTMAQAAHTAEGASFHPVGTANSDTTGLGDICQAGCSDDLALAHLDFWGVQTYRGCSFGSMFSDYGKPNCSRPLIVTEFGVDAWDSLSGASGAENQTLQASCLQTLLQQADQALAVRTAGGVSAGHVVFEWADEWWKAYPLDPPQPGYCEPGSTSWCAQETCKNWNNPGYPDPAMNEEWWGIVGLDSADPAARTLRTATDRVSGSWNLGAVCNMRVASYNNGTRNASLSFVPAPGSTDHTLYYGPLSAVSSYGYTGAVSGLGATGSSSVTLPTGSLFWVVVGRSNAAEGCYGTAYPSGNERPPFPGASVPQSASRTCQCP